MSRATNQVPQVVRDEATEEKSERRVVKKMTTKAWDILELHITEPKLTQTQIAERVDSQQPYVNRVMNSPCFRKELEEFRRQRMHDRLNQVVHSGIDRMERIFADEESSDANAIAAFRAVTDVSGMGSKGDANKASGSASVQVNLGVTPEMIAEANKRRKSRLFDGDCEEVKDE